MLKRNSPWHCRRCTGLGEALYNGPSTMEGRPKKREKESKEKIDRRGTRGKRGWPSLRGSEGKIEKVGDSLDDGSPTGEEEKS